MNPSIYWFSGTGNSLWAARQLADVLRAKLFPMADQLYTGEPCIGKIVILVFPVYNHLIPYLVQRFVRQPDILRGKTVYGVCTCGDTPGISLEYLQKRVADAGGDFAGGFSLRMPYNYISPSHSLRSVFAPLALRPMTDEQQVSLFTQARAKLQDIAAYIRSGRRGTVEIEFARIEHLSDRLHLRDTLQKTYWLRKAGVRGAKHMTSVESVQLMDTGFHVTDDCSGCRTCAQVCPVGNITFTDGNPSWRHRCEQCFACLQWCPQEAVQFGAGTAGGRRYHHPAISLQDIADQSKTRRKRG